MERKDFLVILRKYRSGTATADEKQLIDEWYSAAGAANREDIPNNAKWKEQDWSEIALHIRNAKRLKKGDGTRVLWYSTGIAASLLIACAIYLSVINRQQTDVVASKDVENRATSDLEQVVNTGDIPQLAVLPDGSEVTLAPASELKFPVAFEGFQREVYLQGEAFFEVSHDATRPFLVYANEVVTRVLGTSFTVKAFRDDKNITVAVRSGKVSVFTGRDSGTKKVDETDGIILTPNQQVIYNRDENTIARMIVDAPQEIIPKEEVKRMRFEDAPAGEILDAIERVYGVDIVYDKQVFASCILTTSISDGDLYNRLGAICRAIDATFRIEENKILIKGPGCRN